MKPTYRELLKKHCAVIVRQVLDDMQMYKVGAEDRIPIPHKPILYRWWFPEDSIVLKVLRTYARKNSQLDNLLSLVETRKIEGKIYYALYFGKSNNGYRRYCQHATGNIHLSTLRHTLYGLCIGDNYDKAKEPQITNILRQCYCEWLDFSQEGNLVECVESICIALGDYPLNVEGNPAISDKWLNTLMSKRKID